MKTLFLTLLLLLTFTALMAQAPQRISYQSIIRDANNVVVASSAISVKISLLRGTATGPAVYVETHPITTNANGLVSLNIGEGTAITGTFAGIDWSNGPYLIQTATDPKGGTDYSIIGIAPLNSVPYALNAANASVATTLAGTLPIASGGTGATTATAARAALGLENVDNTSDANKPVSTATQTSLATKVDKVTGKELSTNDYSTAEKAKLAAITGNNTGDQDLSSFATSSQLATKVDKVTGKELSTNDYSTTEKAKLAAISGSNTGDQVNITGNAATATKLQATVTINGIAFDGSSNVTIPATGAVPYTGATKGLDLGAYDLNVNGLTVGRGKGNIVSNTANGVNALFSNTTGAYNTATGYRALYYNTTGDFNTASGTALFRNTTGGFNSAFGIGALYNSTTGSNNTASGNYALSENTTGSNNTAIGNQADVGSGALTNAAAYGANAIVNASNTIQLGNTDVTKVITSGTLTAGSVTYPNTVGSNGQVLTTDGSGVARWALPAALETYTIGLNESLGGYVFYVSPNGKHGLVAETIDQLGASDFPLVPSTGPAETAEINISNPLRHSAAGANFTDWRLPTNSEMRLMYTTIGPGATGPNLNIGNFDLTRTYLTSTLHIYIFGRAIKFADGLVVDYIILDYSNLQNNESARAVRSF